MDDVIHYLLARLAGRNFGVTYVKACGEVRTMLGQVVRLTPEYVTVQEVNLTKRTREAHAASGNPDSDARAFRTMQLRRIREIRAYGQTFTFP